MSTEYLSEFEQEFELDDQENESDVSTSELESTEDTADEYSYEIDDEFESDDEFENEFENEFETEEPESEYESDDEWESEDDSETDDEFENDDELENDYASWARGGQYDRDREFESRIYTAIRSNPDNELQTELELDNVLHEMEQDYFFGSAKRWLKKKAKKYGKFAIPGYGALKAVSSLGRLNIRNLLKNKLLQTAAGFIPGAGPIVSNAMRVAGDVMNSANAAKKQIQDLVQVGKGAYQNLAAAIPDAQSEMEVKAASKMAWKNAIRDQVQTRDHRMKGTSGRRFGRIGRDRTKRVFSLPPNARVAVFSTKVAINGKQQIIPIKPNSIVVVKHATLIVWEIK